MSNLTARKVYNTSLESRLREEKKVTAAAEFGAKAAEERFAKLLADKEQLGNEFAAERARLNEALLELQAEKRSEAELSERTKRTLEERIVVLERQQTEERGESAGKVAAAEARTRTVEEEVGKLTAERNSLQESLANARTQKVWAEEMLQKLEAAHDRLRDDKSGLENDLAASNERVAALTKEKDHLLDERGKLAESLAKSQAEQRGAAELARQEAAQRAAELSAATRRAETEAERAREAQRERDAADVERQRSTEQLGICQSERRAALDLVQKAEVQAATALDDKAAAHARADASDERAREASTARALADAERARAEEALAVLKSERKSIAEIAQATEGALRKELAALQSHVGFGARQ